MKNTINKYSLLSILHAFVLLIATYIVWNIPDDWTNGGSLLQDTHLARSLSAKVDSLPDDLILINTCYDHSMIPVYDEIGIECGVLDVTDRGKLVSLLNYLLSENNYRYIVCDISFDKELESPYDSVLYDLLSKLPRCCIPRSSDGSQLNESIIQKSAISEYYTNINNNNFLKYQYLSSHGESMALKMAKEMNGISISKYGPFYFEGHKLCINSHILDIKTNVNSEYRENQEKNILQLGTDVLPLLESDVKGLFEDKIVMIGDCFRDDIHTTVAGPTSGMMIIYNAYHAICDGSNIPSIWIWVVLFFAYYLLTLFVIYDIKPRQFFLFKKLEELPLLSIALEWVGFGLLFSLIGAASFFISNTYIDAWICASYFTLFERIVSYFRNIKKKN